MAQVDLVVLTLKRLLKSQGITYSHVAAALELSEASVKRLFSEQDLSLARLGRICDLLGIEFLDLMQEVDIDRRRLAELTETQENDLVADKRMLLVAHLVINGYKFEDIRKQYQFSEPELVRSLVKLQKIDFLELLPLNRIKLLVSPSFSWRRGGPVQQFFLENFLDDFFDVPFTTKSRVMCVMSGVLSPQSLAVIGEKIQELEKLFGERARMDSKLPIDERKNCGCVLAVRPWFSKLYDGLRVAPVTTK